MKLKNAILGTSALAGVALLGATAAPASAAEVLPGGALDITISGFAQFEAFGGEQDDSSSTPTSRAASTSATTPRSTSSPAPRARRRAWSTAGRSSSRPTPTTPTTRTRPGCSSGGWGEVRLGDEDGVADNSSVGGQVIAAGTGGIDGSDAVISAARGLPDQQQRRDQGPLLHALVRRLQRRRRLHADAAGPQQRRQQRQFLRLQGRRPRDGRQEHRRGRPGLFGEFGGTVLAGLGGGRVRRAEERRRDRVRRRPVVGRAGRRSVDLFGFKLAGSVATDNVGDTTRTSSPPASAGATAR